MIENTTNGVISKINIKKCIRNSGMNKNFFFQKSKLFHFQVNFMK